MGLLKMCLLLVEEERRKKRKDKISKKRWVPLVSGGLVSSISFSFGDKHAYV